MDIRYIGRPYSWFDEDYGVERDVIAEGRRQRAVNKHISIIRVWRKGTYAAEAPAECPIKTSLWIPSLIVGRRRKLYTLAHASA